MSEDTNTQPTPETAEIAAPSFGIQDLVFLLKVIEVSATRGAFRAEELSSVGLAFDKLRGFLAANNALPEQQQANAEQPAADQGAN